MTFLCTSIFTHIFTTLRLWQEAQREQLCVGKAEVGATGGECVLSEQNNSWLPKHSIEKPPAFFFFLLFAVTNAQLCRNIQASGATVIDVEMLLDQITPGVKAGMGRGSEWKILFGTAAQGGTSSLNAEAARWTFLGELWIGRQMLLKSKVRAELRETSHCKPASESIHNLHPPGFPLKLRLRHLHTLYSLNSDPLAPLHQYLHLLLLNTCAPIYYEIWNFIIWFLLH